MSWKLSFTTAVVSAVALLVGLVHLERTAPLAQKPSIRLRAFTGELPTADLPGVLEQHERDVLAARGRVEQAKTAEEMHTRWNGGIQKVYRDLQERISEKRSGQWSTVYPQQ